MHVSLREGESQEDLLTRFQKYVQKSGLLREYRAHQYFISKPEKARIEARKSARCRQRSQNRRSR